MTTRTRLLALVACLFVVACNFDRRSSPPPPPPPPTGAPTTTTTTAPTPPVAPTTTTAPVPTTTTPTTTPTTTTPTTTTPPTTAPLSPMVPSTTTTPSIPPTTTPPTTPPTPEVPHASVMCTRALRCCTLLAHYAPIRGAAARCQALSHARDAQCSEAISRFAEAILEQGERPPSVCTQPGRR